MHASGDGTGDVRADQGARLEASAPARKDAPRDVPAGTAPAPVAAPGERQGGQIRPCDPAKAADPSWRARRSREAARRLTSQTRFVAAIPAFGFFVCSIIMALCTLVEVVRVTIEYFEGSFDLMELATDYVEYADLFLLAVVLDILSLGLVSLFISDKIPLPEWLSFHDLDDLKERLVSVIGVMLGVYFLGFVLKGGHGVDSLWLGLSCAIVIVALAFFVRYVFKVHHGPEPEPEPEAGESAPGGGASDAGATHAG